MVGFVARSRCWPGDQGREWDCSAAAMATGGASKGNTMTSKKTMGLLLGALMILICLPLGLAYGAVDLNKYTDVSSQFTVTWLGPCTTAGRGLPLSRRRSPT